MSSVYSNNLEATNQILVSGYAVTSGVLAGLDPAVASAALASGNAALVLASSAQASGNAALSVGAVAQASGNSALVVGNEALASGNAALALGGPSASAGVTSSFTAASDIVSGYAVGLDANGSVVAINKKGTDSISVFATNYFSNDRVTTSQNSSCYFENARQWLFGYRATDFVSSPIRFSGQLQCAEISGNSLVYGSVVITPYIAEPAGAGSCTMKMAYLPGKDKAVVTYPAALRGNQPDGFGVSVSSLTPAVGTNRSLGTYGIPHSVAANTSNDTAVIVTANNNNFAGNVISISGTVEAISGQTISYGGPSAPGPFQNFSSTTIWDRKNNRGVLFGVGNATAGYAGVGIGFAASAARLTQLNGGFAPGLFVTPSGTNMVSAAYDYKNNGVMFAYVDSAGSGLNFNPGYGLAVYLQLQENTTGIPFVSSSPVVFNSSPTYNLGSDYDNYNNRFVLAWNDGSNLKASMACVTSGYGLAFSSPTTAMTRQTRASGYVGIGCSHASGTPYTFITYGDNSTTISGFGCVLSGSAARFYPDADGLRPNVIGIAQTSATSGSSVTVALPGSISRIHSGLTPGQYVYPNYTTSGITTDSTVPTEWGQDPTWAPIGVAISPTEAAIINPILPQ